MIRSLADHWFEVAHTDRLLVIRFTRHSILEETSVHIIEDEIQRLVDEASCDLLLLNFYELTNLSSYLLGALVRLKHLMNARHGRLILCSLDPKLFQVFQDLHLDDSFAIYLNEEEALRALNIRE